MQAPPEKHAFVAALNPPGSKLNDALLVVDVDPDSRTYGQRVSEVKMPEFGDELHHFGWNACSSALCPYAPHPHVERRYLVVPGLALVAHSHHRHQAESAKAEDRQSDRAGRSLCARQLFASAHDSLRAGRHLRQRAWSAQWRRSGRHFHARLRDVRYSGPVGNGPRPAISCITISGGIWVSTRC